MTRDVMRDGLRLSLHDSGGAGRAVLFQHGLCGDARQTAEALPAGHGLRRITLECRGHGQSDFGGSLSLNLFTADVCAVAEQLGAETGGPVALGGISMGAAIALRIAVQRPDLVSRLALVRPAWGPGLTAPPNMAPNAEVGRLIASLPKDRARAIFEASATAARLRAEAPDNLNSLLGFFDRAPPDRTAALLQALSADPLGVTRFDLAALRLPVLVCAAPEDAIHPAQLAQDIAAAIPGARLHDLPSKGRDKAAHVAALRAALQSFYTET